MILWDDMSVIGSIWQYFCTDLYEKCSTSADMDERAIIVDVRAVIMM